MNITREVILDLLPAYLSGEASPATRTLVEEHMKEDAELAQRVRLLLADNLVKAPPPVLPPELELRSLRRTQRLLGWQPRVTFRELAQMMADHDLRLATAQMERT